MLWSVWNRIHFPIIAQLQIVDFCFQFFSNAYSSKCHHRFNWRSRVPQVKNRKESSSPEHSSPPFGMNGNAKNSITSQLNSLQSSTIFFKNRRSPLQSEEVTGRTKSIHSASYLISIDCWRVPLKMIVDSINLFPLLHITAADPNAFTFWIVWP